MSTKQFSLVLLCINIYKKIRSIFGTKAVIALSAILYLLYKYSARRHDNIPSAPGYEPIIGHARFIVRQFFHDQENWLKTSTEIHRKLGKDIGMFSIVIPTRRQIYICDPATVDFIFREKFSDAIKGPITYEPIKVMLGHGIFMANGESWRKQRSTASRMFTVRSLKDYMFSVFSTTTDALLDKFDEILPKTGCVIDIYDAFNRLTFEAFTKIAFGVDVGCIRSAPEQSEFGYRFDRALHLTSNRMFSSIPWKLKRMFRRFGICNYECEMDEHSEWIEGFIKNIIRDRKEYYKEKLSHKTDKEKRKLKRGVVDVELQDRFDLLSMFMDDNDRITDKELRDITVNFIVAGKDTTAQMLSWFFYHIYSNNLYEIENKIRAEIEDIFGDNVDDDISYVNVNKCEYIECCLKETLRLYPSVPHLIRTAVKDIKTPNGYTIRKGDEILITTYCMGRMPWIWDEPLRFKPERFMGKQNKYDPSVFPAFNIAPRICLGKHVALLEGKIAIIKLLRKYKHISAVKNQNISWIPSPTNQMVPGFKVYLKET